VAARSAADLTKQSDQRGPDDGAQQNAEGATTTDSRVLPRSTREDERSVPAEDGDLAPRRHAVTRDSFGMPVHAVQAHAVLEVVKPEVCYDCGIMVKVSADVVCLRVPVSARVHFAFLLRSSLRIAGYILPQCCHLASEIRINA